MQTKPEEVVQAFAHALDRDDFEGALVLLSEDCVYEAREACHKGPLSILASYRDASDWAKRELQKVTYESTVLQIDARSASVLFVDRLLHNGVEHTYRCEQRVFLNGQGLIERIKHVEILGEREALQVYFSEVGVIRA